MMTDIVKLQLQAGDGGNGRVSFFRAKYVTKGGPDGGHGGDGGSIYIQADPNINTLRHFAGKDKYVAPKGEDGRSRKQIGAKGSDVVIPVPLGTVIWLVGENTASENRRRRGEFYKTHSVLKSDVAFTKYYLERISRRIPPKEFEDVSVSLQKIFKIRNQEKGMSLEQALGVEEDELEEVFYQGKKILALKITKIESEKDRVLISQGGFGGRGNIAFKSSRNTTPLEAEFGTFGEIRDVILELKMLADVGLVGLPNAGKSTLLSHVTQAHPKIGNYPFTTLEPNLGMISFTQKGEKQYSDYVMADIPGLIKGASEGKGLGYDFLRHIENCAVIQYVLFLTEEDIYNKKLSLEDKIESIWNQYQVLRQELGNHHADLLKKPAFISLNKIDLYSDELIEDIKTFFKEKDLEIIPFSAATEKNLDQVKQKIHTLLK